MLTMTLITAVARNALVGAVATKLVDTLITTKINTKIEHNTWLRNTKLELFSILIDDVFLLNEENFEEKSRDIRRNIAKIILIFKDKKLTKTLEKYLKSLQTHQENYSSGAFKHDNHQLITYLKTHIHL